MSQFDRACRDFAITYLTSATVMLAIAWQLSMAGIAITAFAGLLPMVLASIVAGLRYGEQNGQRPETSIAWTFALHGTAIAVILLICLTIFVLMTLSPIARASVVAGIFQPTVIGMVLAVIAAAHVLTLRYVFQAAGAFNLRIVSRTLST